jgi:hypothetical protein
MAKMDPEDKVLLLATFVPLRGSDDGERALADFIPTLESAIATITTALPNAKPGDVQLLAVSRSPLSLYAYPTSRLFCCGSLWLPSCVVNQPVIAMGLPHSRAALPHV